MNGDEIKTLAESILDQTIEDTFFYSIVNILKDRREDMRPYMFLRKLDTTKSATTSAQALPTDFRIDRKLVIGTTEYQPIRFEDQHLYLNQSGVYFVDYANNTFTILGNPTGAVYFYYIKTTPEITETVGPVWPDRFAPLLAFDVAGYIMNGNDADDIFARMSPENKGQAIALEKAMEAWDTNLQIRSQGGRLGMEGQGQPSENVEQM